MPCTQESGVRIPDGPPFYLAVTKHFRITDEQLAEAVAASEGVMGVLRYLGIREAGGSHSHYSRRIKALGLDTSHFLGATWNKGKKFPPKRNADQILIKRESGGRGRAKELKRALLEKGVKHECSLCGQGPEWRGNPLTLDVDHINENWLDDRIENLRFLCPNCHSQFSRGLIGPVVE